MENHWSAEYRRIVLLIIALLIVSSVTELWVVSAYVFFIGLIFWQYYQLWQLEQLIAGNYRSKDIPDNSGIWERLVQYLLTKHRSQEKEKRRLASIINKNHVMASTIPYGLIILDELNNIVWSNPAAVLHLGIREQDRGYNVSNFIRTLEFRTYINKREDLASLKMLSPTNEKKTLIVTNVNFDKNQRLLITRDITDGVEL